MMNNFWDYFSRVMVALVLGCMLLCFLGGMLSLLGYILLMTFWIVVSFPLLSTAFILWLIWKWIYNKVENYEDTDKGE